MHADVQNHAACKQLGQMLIRSCCAQHAAEASFKSFFADPLSRARSCRARPSFVEGQDLEAYLAAQNFRVNARIVHVLLDVCCFPLQHTQDCCTTLCCTIDMNA